MDNKVLSTVDELNDADEGTIIVPCDFSQSGYYGIALKVTSFDWTLTGSNEIFRAVGLLNREKRWKNVAQIDPEDSAGLIIEGSTL